MLHFLRCLPVALAVLIADGAPSWKGEVQAEASAGDSLYGAPGASKNLPAEVSCRSRSRGDDFFVYILRDDGTGCLLICAFRGSLRYVDMNHESAT